MEDDERFEPIICYCYAVSLNDLIFAIRNGAGSIDEIQTDTRATLGCGACMSEVLDLVSRVNGLNS
jgi:NAD(P)H-nitrite reductase large subunit